MRILKPLVLTKVVLGVAICVSSVPAMANPCVAGAQGCVLPFRDAVVAQPQPVVETPVAVAPVAEPVILEQPKDFPLLLVLLGVAAAAVAAYLLFADLDNDAEPLSP
ncbi:MAG TPA: hypothetical protein VGR19_00330 [Allosphingosinicella sp.]|nr:hypothetical protein [Allosphingosinicella sp.]